MVRVRWERFAGSPSPGIVRRRCSDLAGVSGIRDRFRFSAAHRLDESANSVGHPFLGDPAARIRVSQKTDTEIHNLPLNPSFSRPRGRRSGLRKQASAAPARRCGVISADHEAISELVPPTPCAEDLSGRE